MSYFYVSSNQDLVNYCAKIADSCELALDTEFIRTKTFFPKLGLLQVFDGKVAALIDPLQITQWQCFIDILLDPKMIKYLHACSEDIDVFLHHFNCIPTPIVDTQILASFLDNPLCAGYAFLVKKYLNIELDKSATRTDWLIRPLSTKQCDYAINDVLYLLPLMHKLIEQLKMRQWLLAAYEECNRFIANKIMPINDNEVYLSIKNSWQLKDQQLGQLQKLAKWRYHLAKHEDIAINFIVPELVLWKIAKFHPKSLEELKQLGLGGKEIRLYGKIILDLLKAPTQSLKPILRIINYPNYKTITEQLKLTAHALAKTTGLSLELLISKRLINQYIKWQHDKTDKLPEILSGWRAPLFKQYYVNQNIDNN